MKKKYPGYFFVLILSIVMSMSIGWQSEAKESKKISQAKTEMTKKESTESSEKSVNTKVSSRSTSIRDVSTKPKKEWGDLKNLREFSLNDKGVGIVAYNFGKSMEDIQSLNGDDEAVKEMILYETGAVAYGLSGGKVVDVSEHIEVGDLGDLFSVSSNDLAEHHITLTVPAKYSGTDKDLITDIIIYTGKVAKVSTWEELDKALNPGRYDEDITVIDVQKSMVNTFTNRDPQFKGSRKDFVLLGNGYSLDFRMSSYYWWTDAKVKHNVTMDNVDLYGQDYYGPITMRNHFDYESITSYRHVNYHGAQVTASFGASVQFFGKNYVKSTYPNYISFDGQTIKVDTGEGQAGLEAHTLRFKENSDTTIETDDGNGIALGGWWSNGTVVRYIQPLMEVEKNATTLIRTLGDGGENTSWQMDDNDPAPAVISIHRNGRIQLDEKAHLITETAPGTIRIPVQLGHYSNSDAKNWVTRIDLAKNSKFDANINGPIPSKYAGIYLQDKSEINIGQNAQMNIDAKGMIKGSPVISMGTESKINVDKSGLLSINKHDGIGNMLTLGSKSVFNVFDEGNVEFVSKNETDSKDSMIYGGSNSNFIIGERGNFTSRIEDGTGARNMLDFARNANFSFANARRVDLDARKNTNAALINMDRGVFNASIQQVRAWKKENSSDEEATYNWRPMYNMKVPYRNQIVTTNDVSAGSMTYVVRDDFKNNYKTQDFSRVVFDYIPDVKLAVEDISDNVKLSSGQKIYGTVNPGAYVAFYKVVSETDSSKDTFLTTPSYNSPEEGDNKRKFHVMADKSGNYTFDIPSSVALKAGEKIRVYAFLDGKDDNVIKEVQDKTPPTGEGVHYYESVNNTTPLPEKFVTNIKDTNPNNKSFTYKFNKDTPQEVVDGYMSQIGEHVVKVDVSDEAGNTTTIDAKLTIIKTDTNLTSEDMSISYKDLRTMSENDIKQYILKNGKLEAYKLSDGQKEDVTPFISVKDLNGLADLSNIKSTPYKVSLVVPAKDAGTTEDIIGEINVTVTDIDSIVTLQFINEVDNVMDDYTATIKAKVGDVIDLTKNEILVKQIAQLNKDGYLIDQDKRPEKETSFSVTDTEVVTKYKVHGTIQFQSVPTELNFGSVKYIARPSRVEKPTYDNNLVVRDTRSGQANGFSVTASITTPLQTKDGKKLQDVLRYVLSGKETILSEAEEPIYQIDTGKNGLHDISKNWSDKKESDGIKLQLGSSGDIHTGQYTGEITWKIMEGRP